MKKKPLKVNIFIEDEYKNFKIEINLKKVLLNCKKLFRYTFENNSIFNQSCLNGLQFKSVCFDIVLVSDEKIQEINRDYRKKDLPTDVITFAIFADDIDNAKNFIIDSEINLGEIIISLDTVLKNSVSNPHFESVSCYDENKMFIEEFYFVISHGILHLLGFDHQNNQGYNVMMELQNKMRGVINV